MESLLDNDALSILFKFIFPGLLKSLEAGTGLGHLYSWLLLPCLVEVSAQ